MISIDNSIRRTMVFDYGTILIRGDIWDLKVHIYTTPGHDYYAMLRLITLEACDGVIFVADSQEDAYYRSFASWIELIHYFGKSLKSLPLLIAFNKQDLPHKFNSNQMLKHINFSKLINAKTTETIAISGEGIVKAFMELLDLIFKKQSQEKNEGQNK
ncbi:MAG: ADP-ribosylation factor-like protein [Candidatus Hermodarchaeota archaeon]